MSIIQTNYTAIHEWNDWRHLEDLISKKKTILKYYETLAILTIVFTREKKSRKHSCLQGKKVGMSKVE
jgi:hypothetical protein